MTYLQKSQENELKLRVRCQDLHKIYFKDILNPFLVIRAQRFEKEPETIYTGEPLANTFNPAFPEELTISYSFQDNQRYIFQIFCAGPINKFVAEAKVSIKELLAPQKGALTRELASGLKKGGRISLETRLVDKNCEFIYLKLRGEELLFKSWWGWLNSEHVFFRINKIWENHSKSLYVSEALPYNKTIQWKQFYIEYNEKYELIENSRIEVLLCYQKPQSQEIVGRVQVGWKELGSTKCLNIMDKEKHQRGKFSLSNYKVQREHTFAEFLKAGMEISLTIGIDCSASIKPASNHLSPHNIAKGRSTYETAMLTLSAFLLDYTSNSSASIYAIGAKAKHPKIYTGEKVQQCFPINGDFECPQVSSQQFSQTYRNVLNFLEFSGPTDITKIIRTAMASCLEMKRQKEEFSVLVILSDGKLNNLNEIKALLQECATLPIFIAFLAIGDESPDLHALRSVKMEVFTGDKCLAEREDIVNVEHYSKGKNIYEVARKLFRNLPHVVSRYMSLRKKTPEDIEKLIKKKLTANTDNPEG